jgi:hypothetical protein
LARALTHVRFFLLLDLFSSHFYRCISFDKSLFGLQQMLLILLTLGIKYWLLNLRDKVSLHDRGPILGDLNLGLLVHSFNRRVHNLNRAAHGVAHSHLSESIVLHETF